MARRWAGVLRSPLGASAAVLVAAILVLAVLAPLLWTDAATATDTARISQGASAEHWAGTDSLGRDIFARVLVATSLSVRLALAATAIGVVVGLLLGTAPLLVGRRAGRLVTAVVNIAVAFPGLLLALFFAVIFGVGATGALFALGLAIAPAFARLTQTTTARVAGLDYVAAARIAGVGRFRVLFRHVLPNVAEPLVVNATVAAGSALLAFAGLSFLGLGVQPPDYDWGRLLGEGLGAIYLHPAAALAPGVAVVLAGLAFNLFGEALAKVLGERRPLERPVRRTAAEPAPDDSAMLVVEDLRVAFPGVEPVRGVGFAMDRGDAVGIVGESGSGKSLTALAVSRLVDESGEVRAERLSFLGADLRAGPHRRLLGTSLAMVFQDPMTSFNPTMRIGRQLAEVACEHQGLGRAAALDRAVDRLDAVRIPEPARRAAQYPHEFSGGMRQRAMIGMGLMGSPALIVADEPTTALDVTVQRRVLSLLADIRAADDVALLLISHDVTVVEQVCDRVLVMYAGRIVEDLPSAELRSRARHPYTRALLAAVPDMTTDRSLPLAVIPGRPADPAHLPTGCAFAPRCPLADERCTATEPDLVADDAGRRVACWHADIPVEVRA
ncbi:dipeptide/oligopeptide/nickel ABC transporter permease/ATP-binding protein [Actinophytocola gossypii]|uniref:Dipeptide/oligopeptide/nickel ABC transporter permease/ATP-binding protein n=1 Tax=Actinophytocola gossypii TaxID=2812003 RepID=A0ABT2J6H3_9PSEU|nr:dipeptide/oligopeptide/nickel ABC transporter permease/ATP-binding protein [Actinophytocola gossypii]MCT2583462.1 dipeptide/oligopeptide/nickel ABC transporter permease/ATP-binding protein [Actinophytocola gossypii]